MRTNLFDFATSELSQDAFLCWLAALASHDNPERQQLGRTFIAWLWESSTGNRADVAAVQLIAEPRQQWQKIDVTLEVIIDGVRARILIEDKTETSHHSGQLVRYIDLAKQDGVTVVPVYFKTGYHFGSDTDARAAGYTVIGLREWVSFLNDQTLRNDIFDDYRAYTAGLLEKRDKAVASLKTPLGFEQLKESFVQYELIGELSDRCQRTVGGRVINRGTNMGGSPWTHYCFARHPAVLPGGIDEVLFHRVDKRQDDQGNRGRYYLSTRQYAPVKGNRDAADAKLKRLKAYRAEFSSAIQEVTAELTFATPATDLRGANESEIAVLFFDESNNTTLRILELFPSVHEAFVRRIAGSRDQG